MPNKPPRLHPGDRVRLVSPASTPEERHVQATKEHLEHLGLEVELGDHVYDRFGYLAGTDAARLSDLNDAFRDPEVKAVIATRGGKGAYRIAGDLDFEAAARNPKLLVGFSEITILHLALFKNCGLSGIHGAPWLPEFSRRSAASFEAAAFTDAPVVIESDPRELTSALTTCGVARGRLIGGNQEMVATAAGWILPPLDGAILLLEAYGLRIGQMDRHLTMLERAGHLGGLPIGHGDSPFAVPVGTMATLDAESGSLIVESAVS